jgi:hypothetical protein
MALNSSAIAKKWATRAGSAGGAYKDGVTSTPKDQAALAIAAAPNYEEGISSAIADKRFEKGLAKSGKAGWLKGASGKGATNYPAGVRLAEADYQSGVQPYLSALDSITYPPRGPRRSPQNIARVQAVMDALGKLKESM